MLIGEDLRKEMNAQLGRIGTGLIFQRWYASTSWKWWWSGVARESRAEGQGTAALLHSLWGFNTLHKLLRKIQIYVILLPQPPTAKMHAIIERTANFVCKQGAQFEIMLKAKQARNSQFDFLRFDHYLNPYYKFIQKAMKEGRYAAPSENKADEKKRESLLVKRMISGCESLKHPLIFFGKAAMSFCCVAMAVLLSYNWDWCDDSKFWLSWGRFLKEMIVLRNCQVQELLWSWSFWKHLNGSNGKLLWAHRF